MKHRLASQGPTGRLWPSFTILLSFSSFCCGGINAVPPSPSSFYLCVCRGLLGAEAVSTKSGWERRGGGGGRLSTSFVSLFRDLQAEGGGDGGENGGNGGGLMEGEERVKRT